MAKNHVAIRPGWFLFPNEKNQSTESREKKSSVSNSCGLEGKCIKEKKSHYDNTKVVAI